MTANTREIPSSAAQAKEMLNKAEQRVERLSVELGVALAPRLRSFGFKASDSRDGLMTFIASTEDVDRAGDVIRQDGWNLSNFRKNNVYLWMHDYRQVPIGNVPRIWVESNQLRNTVKFDQKDPFAASVERKFRDGVLTAQSVGFRPTEFTRLDDGGYEFTKQELLEISAVTVPMNQSALRLRSFSTGVRLFTSSSSFDPFDRLARRLRNQQFVGNEGRLSPINALRIRQAIRTALR